MSRFDPPSRAQRGQLAQLLAAAQAHRPSHGEHHGTMRCACGAPLHFSIRSNGLSRGACTAACGVRWYS